jgi:hypothetical protein
VTPQVQARLACAERVRVTVTLLDGSPVTEVEATCTAVDRRLGHALYAFTDDDQEVRVPLEPVDAAVLPLPRPRPTSGDAA